MILRSVNFSNQTPSRSSKALLFELASFLIDIEHYPLCITPHRIIDKKNALSCKMFSCSSNLAFAVGSQFCFANNGEKLGCVLYMGAQYTRVNVVIGKCLFALLKPGCCFGIDECHHSSNMSQYVTYMTQTSKNIGDASS